MGDKPRRGRAAQINHENVFQRVEREEREDQERDLRPRVASYGHAIITAAKSGDRSTAQNMARIQAGGPSYGKSERNQSSANKSKPRIRKRYRGRE